VALVHGAMTSMKAASIAAPTAMPSLGTSASPFLTPATMPTMAVPARASVAAPSAQSRASVAAPSTLSRASVAAPSTLLPFNEHRKGRGKGKGKGKKGDGEGKKGNGKGKGKGNGKGNGKYNANQPLKAPPSMTTVAGSSGLALGSASTGRSAGPMLQAGSTLQIRGVLYHVKGPLGMGSFGAVWAAERRDGVKGEVAIKEILCRSQKELEDATLEGSLLRMIHSNKPGQLVGTVPDLVSMETEPFRDCSVMKLVLTKVPGMQLDTFLDICRRQGPGCSDNAVLVAAAAVTAESQSLSGACRFARSLLSQLASTFDCMGSVVYHRDVSPHNILIDTADSRNPRFGLVDFGLGIDSQSWHGPKGTASWHYVDIGGDCRYWPVSVWVMFVSGSDVLEMSPALAQEYKTRLDFHAVGITVLEILMMLLPPSALSSEEMRSLQAAWNQYWQNVTGFWKRTMQIFESGEDPVRLKQWLRTEGRVSETVGNDLAVLRSALRRAGDACSRGVIGGVSCSPDSTRLFRTLLALVGSNGTVGLEDSNQGPTWQTVRSLIDADSTCATGKVVSSGPVFTSYSGGAVRHTAGSLVVPSGCKMQDWKRSSSPLVLKPRSVSPFTPQYSAVRAVR